jgi:hypothetical protein
MSAEPCVLLVLPDFDERRLLMAELIERDLDPLGFESLGQLWVRLPTRGRCPRPRAILVDRRAIAGRRLALLELARSRWPAVPLLLFSRPISIRELAGAIQALARGAGSPVPVGQNAAAG